MSRIIVKNLPKNITKEKLQEHFAGKGIITDVDLKYSQRGVFRRFAFIGYKTDAEAQSAIDYFHNSYINTSKLKVEKSLAFGDAELQTPWIKAKAYKNTPIRKDIGRVHQEKNSEFYKGNATKNGKSEKKSLKGKETENHSSNLVEDLQFREFLELHNSKKKPTWCDSGVFLNEENSNPGEDFNSSVKEKYNISEKKQNSFPVVKDNIENTNFKRKFTGVLETPEVPPQKKLKIDIKAESTQKKKKKKKKSLKTQQSFGKQKKTNERKRKYQKYAVKMSNLSFTCRKKEMKQFLLPLVAQRLLTPNVFTGYAIACFKNEDEVSHAISKNGQCLNGKKVCMTRESNHYESNYEPYETSFANEGKNEMASEENLKIEELSSEENKDEVSFEVNEGKKQVISEESEEKKMVTSEVNERRKKVAFEENEERGKVSPECKVKSGKEKEQELLGETGRLFLKNVASTATETDLEEFFGIYGPLSEVHLPVNRLTKSSMGFGFVTYVFPEHAVTANSELNGSIFQGRVLKIKPARSKKNIEPEGSGTNYKKNHEAQLKSMSGSSHNWNILFLGMNAVADVTSERYNIDKSKLLSGDSGESVAVRMALAETQAVVDTRKFLIDQGVVLDAFSQPAAERSKTVIIVKNLPAKTSSEDILDIFSKHGSVNRVILPPSGLVAMVEFQEPTDAKAAFKKLAYSRFRHLPLYLEWAPINVIDPSVKPVKLDEQPSKEKTKNDEVKNEDESDEEDEKSENVDEKSKVVDAKSEEEDDEEPEPDTTVFVKNINSMTTQEKFKKHFKKCGQIHSASISMKKDVKTGQLLSMGFGFVQFKEKVSAVNAVQHMQLSMLDGHALEVKFATRSIVPTNSANDRKKAQEKKQRTCKILVRNIPFEASEGEVRDLFKEFGTLKFVRLPKKLGGTDGHRGFGFVEYLTKTEAKRAFETLCHSTHLLGRRLVLEWANTETEDDITELRKKTAHTYYNTGTSGSKLTKRQLIDAGLL